ncbi:Deoxyribose-phosphate aldolase [Mycoplasmoides gallisepticum str. R(low)]|uniref:Deoxyribose-phosphate aldolase n=1 Tax=Mycoplasmoides gallisepticum (strain R(low / passage 15 / clone 2)) TaxID=710127 RepID=DEOC_MYCGA|nr:deoxyribose-phosphate aldolase [Mycoplasmoides gallisepticum]Q7NAQ0.2 RecName: Full=Deoxyribose-phosphate aldolase; Short=DERA; AltName: Full=2-deoxy-D-ribose 5-phosphate aldolase; AltName: Full=Phosphodeoxyriboaldolase; Short=Deoxyriboaldolase [Mycoplasmoides gallisepticum str. R(low)]AAP56935.2 Deoxyribose-phosphate aldolase [Mycoplasmoides gallisepticum str. R(low)]ADC30799.1 Deoxyribose-phosphate aldolase [Mycoplasmoides gallisepticum str. R(high)]
MSILNFNKLIDHTNLKANATYEEIERLCHEAIEYGFFSVCVNPAYIRTAKKILLKSPVKVCTVVDFPLGQTFSEQKVYEAKTSIKMGADEIDMVINIPELINGCACVIDEIRQVKKVCGEKILKVIVETALLNEEQIRKATLACIDGGADFIKTSTGFSTRGASLNDIKIMQQASQNKILIKASGGISTARELIEFVKVGADRIGTSRSVKLMQELKTMDLAK